MVTSTVTFGVHRGAMDKDINTQGIGQEGPLAGRIALAAGATMASKSITPESVPSETTTFAGSPSSSANSS
ncbi:hypothetical protein SAMN05216511_0738 [Streptomyces sp. KS_16]|nr:hypothetical protein BX261_6512 [Streptomyces sp. 2321.6]SDQ84701.1 hypothetical protein SAMN05216511_0738 [Streptomyces sp. KS_16]SED98164.1 hypothetical protein SAMN05428940_6538 [Streptomyces sp. 2133.1]SNC73347.1 hypothetical protein SAMN06272741_6441 [Streptomyces sp. 2114.4]